MYHNYYKQLNYVNVLVLIECIMCDNNIFSICYDDAEITAFALRALAASKLSVRHTNVEIIH